MPHPAFHDLFSNAARRFRIDAFSVPEASRASFEAQLRRNLAFIQTLPGFLGHTVFEKAAGPTAFDVITVAAWESAEALERAGERVRAHSRESGVDLPAMLAQWGVKAELGHFRPRGDSHASLASAD